MSYKLEDYRRCGLLWYPVRFLPDDSIEVIDEPKDEREMRDMLIEETKRETAVLEAENEITRQIIRDNGTVSKAYVDSVCDAYGIDTSVRNPYYFQLWNFLLKWHYTNRKDYGFESKYLNIIK